MKEIYGAILAVLGMNKKKKKSATITKHGSLSLSNATLNTGISLTDAEKGRF